MTETEHASLLAALDALAWQIVRARCRPPIDSGSSRIDGRPVVDLAPL